MDKIIICVNDVEMHHHARNNHLSIWGVVYIKVNGCAFPDDCWYDCLDMLIPCWIGEIEAFVRLNKESCALDFFDGPYRLLLRRIGNTLEIACIRRRKQSNEVCMTFFVELASFLREITKFCGRVIYYCKSCNPEFQLLPHSKKLYSALNSARQYTNNLPRSEEH